MRLVQDHRDETCEIIGMRLVQDIGMRLVRDHRDETHQERMNHPKFAALMGS